MCSPYHSLLMLSEESLCGDWEGEKRKLKESGLRFFFLLAGTIIKIPLLSVKYVI